MSVIYFILFVIYDHGLTIYRNHYPYYQQNDDRWKNSVRHNLSINPQFRKGKKASQGAGHFWNISDTISQSQELNNNKTPTFCRSIDSLRHEKVSSARVIL